MKAERLPVVTSLGSPITRSGLANELSRLIKIFMQKVRARTYVRVTRRVFVSLC